MRRQCFGIFAWGLAGLGLFAGGMLVDRRSLALAGSLIAGVAGAWSLLRCQKAGLLRTHQGLVRRAERPALFRFHMSFGWTAVLLWTLGGVLLGLGLFGR